MASASMDPDDWKQSDWDDRIARHEAMYGLSERDLHNLFELIANDTVTLEADGTLVILKHDLFQDAYLHVLINEAKATPD